MNTITQPFVICYVRSEHFAMLHASGRQKACAVSQWWWQRLVGR